MKSQLTLFTAGGDCCRSVAVTIYEKTTTTFELLAGMSEGLIAGVVVTIVVVATVAVHIVDDGVSNITGLERDEACSPIGLDIVPPSVSQIAPTTIRIGTGDERAECPDNLEAAVCEASQSSVW